SVGGRSTGSRGCGVSALRGVARRHDDYQSIAAAPHGLHIEALADKVNAAKMNYKPPQRFTLRAGNSAYQPLGGDVDGDDKAELIAVRLTRFRAVIWISNGSGVIVNWAKEFPPDPPVRLLVHLHEWPARGHGGANPPGCPQP